MTEPHVKLPRNAEELLRDFPVAEPDFEAQAEAIEARLQAAPVAAPVSDDELFGAPALAAEPNEPSLFSQVRAAPKSNFAEMARRSLNKSDDGAATLAKELLAATSQLRRPNAELVQRVRAAGKSPPTATPVPLSEPRRERSSGVVARGDTVAPGTPAGPAAPASRTSDQRGVVVALVGVAFAAAAAVVLFAGGSPPSAPLAAEAGSRAPAAAVAEPAQPTPQVAAPSQDQGVVSPEALAVSVPEAKPAEGVRSGKAGGSSPAPVKVGASKGHSAPEPVALPETSQPLATVEAQAPQPAEAPEPLLRPAEGLSGGVPLNPSSGAVSTALGAVRSGAQACLAGQTTPVTATVTFASDGHVLRVSAAGPSGDCIRAALSKAHIAPFAKESFSAPTTIRPP